MRDKPWYNPEWNEVRDEAEAGIATAGRLVPLVDGPVVEKLNGALATLREARIHGSMADIHAATAVLRGVTDEILLSLGPPSNPRNGTSGVTGVENPDGEPSRSDDA